MLPMLNQGLALICLLNIALTLPSEARLAALKAQSAPGASPAQNQGQGKNPAQSQEHDKNNDNDDQSKNEDQKREGMEEGIKHLLVTQIEAWNHGNLEGFMAGYWRSPDLTFFSGGTVTKGWEPTLQRYQQRYQSKGNEMGKLEFQDLNIDLLSGRSAVVTGKWQLTMSDGKQPHGLFTLIVKRIPPTGWKIVHDHTSSAE
jgi:beta-aspartyl-peptidase (threonine type)